MPSLTTVSWLLSLLARFFSLTSMTASKAVWVGPMSAWYLGSEADSFLHAVASWTKSFWARNALATCCDCCGKGYGSARELEDGRER